MLSVRHASGLAGGSRVGTRYPKTDVRRSPGASLVLTGHTYEQDRHAEHQPQCLS